MKQENFLWSATKTGLLAGAITLYLCLIGMVEIFNERFFIEDIVTLGQFILFTTAAGAGYIAARRTSNLLGSNERTPSLSSGAVAGLIPGLTLAALVVIGNQINLRAVFLNASPGLYQILTFEQGLSGIWIWPLICSVFGVIGSVYFLLSSAIRQPVNRGLIVLVALALFSGLLRVVMINQGLLFGYFAKFLFGQTGLTLAGALIFFFGTIATFITWKRRGNEFQARVKAMPRSGQLALRIFLLLLIGYIALGLPQVSGPFIAQVIVLISLYVLMGLGLNITLGFAGLLDLGFVAFYAVGAYTVGLLTSYGPFGLQHVPFWVAVPIAVLVAMFFGALLGLPVLGVRGDYLAIATMGFGEIVRILAGSDFLSPFFGGPRGVIGIQKPCLGTLGPFISVDTPRVCNGIELGTPQDIYYLAVVSAIFIAFVAWRLRESRLGRAWMAIREDEDVAEALGINLIQTKLLAYILGAAFAGLGGAIFTVLIGSIFASSMRLDVSIYVVALIIVGGMGSIPGVIVGAIALIGLPELLREVSEFRLLFYGFTLIAIMLARPEGLWPSQATKRELHHVETETTVV